MHPVVADRLAMRERARALGDKGLERACNADLERYGYGWGTGTTQVALGLQATGQLPETTEAEALPERTVPPRPGRGRPKLPRCEHGGIVGRCVECEDYPDAA